MSTLHQLLACATCMADPDSSVGRAAGMSILFMVVVICSVLGLLIRIMFNFARRQRQQHNNLP